MTEQEWFNCNEPGRMLEFLGEKASERKLRLYMVACHRRVWDRLTDLERKAPAATEQYLEGNIPFEELDAAYADNPLFGDGASASPYKVERALGDAEYVTEYADDPDEEAAAQAAFVRDIFGNPCRPPAVDAAWLTTNVKVIAREIFLHRRWENLPLLADALEDAGCADEQILGHCRGHGEHVRGCWVVDLAMGGDQA